MSEYYRSSWASQEFQRQYLDRADIYIPERRRFFALAADLFRQFYAGRQGVRVVDLGSGDGPLAHELLRADPTLRMTLVDGSEGMLMRADERLGMYENVAYLQTSFEELISGEKELGAFDLAVSAMAIHHLTLEEKAALFGYIHGRLTPGGWFVNIDPVLPPSADLERWYFALWEGAMREAQRRAGVEGDLAADVMKRYKDDPVNKPDTLEDQLGALRAAGFVDVDCFYKSGIFAVFGGRRASDAA
jgi:tRNA (cmo5U34)-methyltransferase